MPGELVEIEGDLTSMLAALEAMHASGFDVVVVGGLAVMLRLEEAHRVTADIDGVFDNDTETPTTTSLIAQGVGLPGGAPQRVVVGHTVVDVIDTFSLPTDATELPDDPKGRLFVCAHRYAFETAGPLLVPHGGHVLEIAVATRPALVAMKAHALRYAAAQRRSTKRSSDLHDLYRLAADNLDDIVAGLDAATWKLRSQVAAALDADLGRLEQDVALLRRRGVDVDPDDVVDVLTELLDRLNG